MNKLIKREWIKRIMNSHLTPEYILNMLYEEVTGDLIRFPNRWGLKDDDGKISETIKVGLIDPIQPRVKDWAGLDSTEPLLPSYSKVGGVGLGFEGKNLTLYAVWRHGMVETPVGDTKKMTKIRMGRETFCKLIEMDL